MRRNECALLRNGLPSTVLGMGALGMGALGMAALGMAALGMAMTIFVAVGPVKADPAYSTLEALGEALFFDTNQSLNRTQACATCHDPSAGFVDLRSQAGGIAVSLGDDGTSLGDRVAPTASYARFSPAFHQNQDGEYVGGQFWDGRESDLTGQAGGPPLNPIEMGMPDKRSVVARLQENADYVDAFERFFGPDVLQDAERGYEAFAQSIAAFESTDFFAPFDSKYDRFLRGETRLSDEEELGRLLFFSQQFSNCNRCHQLEVSAIAARETFTNYEFHNIGVPVNIRVRAENGLGEDHVDQGLLANPAVEDPAQAGKFKVPTLRNVAVTGPYMHNGVFADLRTVLLFYNKYNSRAEARQINPETQERWAPPEIAETLSVEDLTHGPALDDKRIDALLAFLRTLTDRRYEPLLQD